MVNDSFGIVMKYPSSQSNQQSFVFPTSVSQLNNSGILQTKVAAGSGSFVINSSGDTIAWYEFAPESGNDAKLLILPSSMTIQNGNVILDVDCDLNHEEAHTQGYVNNVKEWRNIEMTSHLFIKSVRETSGYFFFEARNGYNGSKGGCCQGTAYGVRLYWSTGDNKGKFAFYKKEFTGSTEVLSKQSQTTITSFYQEWFGAKFAIYNNAANDRVNLELWLSPVTFGNPSHSTSNAWIKVGEAQDYSGRGWNKGGKECDAETNDAPITWATPFIGMGWKDGKVIQWNYTSFREIDPTGNFGEDPEPEEPEPTFPDPELPDPDPEPAPEIPLPPVDADPPALPQTLTKRFTLRREVVNNTACKCDGIQSDAPGEDPTQGGGGGGTQPPTGGGGNSSGVFTVIYRVSLNTSDFGRLAAVDDNSGYYLRFGQACTRTSSTWLGKTINRVAIPIGKVGNPTGTISCVIRKGSDDSIAATLTPSKSATEISTGGTPVIFDNLTNTYKMALDDKMLIEFSGGNINNYIKIFRAEQSSKSGTKIMYRNNEQDPGEYGDFDDLDLCASIFSLTP